MTPLYHLTEQIDDLPPEPFADYPPCSYEGARGYLPQRAEYWHEWGYEIVCAEWCDVVTGYNAETGGFVTLALVLANAEELEGVL